MKLSFLATLLASAACSLALTPAEWRNQSIYQLLTDRFARTDGSTTAACNTGNQNYCGGSWQGIINHLDYIQDMGFTAIWISPIVVNLPQSTADGEGYHGYWAQQINQVNPNFGTEADLKALSAALHARGMFLMVDVVTNHMGYAGAGDSVNYAVFDVFNQESYFHPFCLITDFTNQEEVETCWEGDNIVSLPDLRTEDADVLSMWETWIENIVSTYSVDGLRVDSCAEVDQQFFPPFQSAANVHMLCEVDNGDPAYVCPYQNFVSGMLNYPAYFWITQAFESTTGSISNLFNGINTMKGECLDTTLLGSFMENHDNPRFPSLTSDISLDKNAIAFTMLADGIPIIYAGQEQHYSGGGVPFDREATWLSGYSTTSTFYTFIAGINQIRNWAIFRDPGYVTFKADPIYQDSHTIAMRKGTAGTQVVGVFNNFGASGSSFTLTLSGTGYTPGQVVMEIITCTQVTTDGNGNIAVAQSGGAPRIYYPLASLTGSGICGIGGTAPSPPPNPAPTTTAPPGSCTTALNVDVTFNEIVTTIFGQTIKLAGSISQLGDWDTDIAVPLSAADYTATDNIWFVTLSLPAGTTFQYKFINVASDGAVTWESDPNRSFTVPTSCSPAVTINDSWR